MHTYEAKADRYYYNIMSCTDSRHLIMIFHIIFHTPFIAVKKIFDDIMSIGLYCINIDIIFEVSSHGIVARMWPMRLDTFV